MARQELSLMQIFPPEILLDILTRLPIKCVGHCRCVSKSWRLILSEVDFIKGHLVRTKQFIDNELLILKSRESNTLFSGTISRPLLGEITVLATELTFIVSPTCQIWIAASCDGLILLTEDGKSKSSLVNPTTKEVRELHVPSHDLDAYARDTTYGLGYDHVNDDYKVVALSCYNTEPERVMFSNVYSVRDGTWKQVESSPYFPVSFGVFVGSSIHWIAINPSYYSDYSQFIARFDLIEEKFWKVPAPSSIFSGSYEYDNLVVLGGCLCMLDTVSTKEIIIWVMKEYGVLKSWTKISIVDEQGSELIPFLGIPGQRELVILKDKYTHDVRFSMYNLDTATFQDMTIHGINGGSRLVGSFRETLVSPYYNHTTKSG